MKLQNFQGNIWYRSRQATAVSFVVVSFKIGLKHYYAIFNMCGKG